MKIIYNKNARAALFTLFLIKHKEVYSKDAVTFIVSNFGMDKCNSYRYIRHWIEEELIESKTLGRRKVLIFKGDINVN